MADSENKPKRTHAENLAAIAARIAAGREAAEQKAAETPRQMFLPGMDETLRAMPNQIALSSLFAPVARGKREMHAGTVMVSRSDAVLEYWGIQLNELHADISLQLLYGSRDNMGGEVKLDRAEFMRALGWTTGGASYERFHRYMKELTAATLFIEAKKPDGSTKYKIGRTQSFRLLAELNYDDATETYTYKLDPRWVLMFGNREYSLIDWDKRLQIGNGQDLAKSLQRLFVTTNDSPQRHSLEFLKARAQHAGRTRDFRTAITKAMDELARLGIVVSWKIEKSTKGKEQLTVWRLPE